MANRHSNADSPAFYVFLVPVPHQGSVFRRFGDGALASLFAAGSPGRFAHSTACLATSSFAAN